MADENNPPAPEVPPPAPVPGENPPPAATLAVNGEVKSERELALERREAAAAARDGQHRELETTLAERERKIQEREEALRGVPPPAPAAPKKAKRKRNWSDPVNAPEEIEE